MTKIAGIGIDVEEPGRFVKHLPTGQHIPHLISWLFSDDEIEHNRRSDPKVSFVLGFSCKEAFFKAFGVSWTNSPITWQDVELIFENPSDMSEYFIRLGGHARQLYEQMACTGFEAKFEIFDDHVIFEVVLVSD